MLLRDVSKKTLHLLNRKYFTTFKIFLFELRTVGEKVYIYTKDRYGLWARRSNLEVPRNIFDNESSTNESSCIDLEHLCDKYEEYIGLHIKIENYKGSPVSFSYRVVITAYAAPAAPASEIIGDIYIRFDDSLLFF